MTGFAAVRPSARRPPFSGPAVAQSSRRVFVRRCRGQDAKDMRTRVAPLCHEVDITGTPLTSPMFAKFDLDFCLLYPLARLASRVLLDLQSVPTGTLHVDSTGTCVTLGTHVIYVCIDLLSSLPPSYHFCRLYRLLFALLACRHVLR